MNLIRLSKFVLIAGCMIPTSNIFAAREIGHGIQGSRSHRNLKVKIEDDLQSPLFPIKGDERYRVAFKTRGQKKMILVYEKMDGGWVEVSSRRLGANTPLNVIFKNKAQIKKREGEILKAQKREIDLFERRLSLYGIDLQTSPRAIKHFDLITKKYSKKREALWLSSKFKIQKDKDRSFVLVFGQQRYLLGSV